MGAFLATPPALGVMLCAALTFSVLAPSAHSDGGEQSHRLANGELAVTIVTGKKRELPRFDATASVDRVVVNGRDFIRGEGLVDEFGLEGFGVLGFEGASPGDVFIKIGVGLLERDEDRRYRFQRAYPLKKTFPVEVVASATEVRVTQLSDELRGFRYAYEKRYSIELPGCLQIAYTLSNRGRLPFSFEHYNHNFFRLPEKVGARGVQIETGFELHSSTESWNVVTERRATWIGDAFPKAGEFWRMPLRPAADATAHTFLLTLGDGASVRVAGDTPVTRFAMWLENGAVCPEVFSRFEVQTGETVRWSRTYCFSAELGGELR